MKKKQEKKILSELRNSRIMEMFNLIGFDEWDRRGVTDIYLGLDCVVFCVSRYLKKDFLS
jgi:hypothetical protein